MTNGAFTGIVQIGEVIAGKYRVDSVLGEGGMGVVVAATHIELDQLVALKFLLPAVATRPDLVQRFMREARAAVRIHSEHVARVLDVGTHNGSPYMVMEHLQGSDLDQLLTEKGALPPQDAVGYVLEASEAIAEAHALGIVHRDLKPANLFLTRRPNGASIIKVLDFGISKSPATARDKNITAAAEIMGSPSYMSPEQLVSSASVDVRSDIWALGVVLYQMLSCDLPFLADTMPELVAIILAKPPEPMKLPRGPVPSGLQAVVARCLEKDPARRFSNVAELARALLPFGPPRSAYLVERVEHVLGEERSQPNIPTSEPSFPILPAAAAHERERTLSPTSTKSASTPRNRALMFAPLLLLAVVGIGVAAVMAHGSKANATRDTMPSPTTPSATASQVASVLAAASESAAPTTPPENFEIIDPAATTGAAVNADPTHTHRHTHPVTSASPSASAAPSASAPCRSVSYFDSDGNKHFKPCQ